MTKTVHPIHSLHCSALTATDEARKRYGLKLFHYLRSGTPLGSDCPELLLAARSAVRANLHAAEAWYLADKVKENYLLAQQALKNDDSETAEKYLRKAKEIDAARKYEQKEADARGLTHLRALKKVMGVAQNFEQINYDRNQNNFLNKIMSENLKAEQLKQRQRKSVWSEALQLEREKFSTFIRYHAPPAARNKNKFSTRQKLFIHLREMTGGCSS